MSRSTPVVILLALAFLPANVTSVKRADPDNLVAHEWGTFTSVAGENGDPIGWYAIDVQQDLPCFVDRFRNFVKTGLAGTVRMETPVLYFYAPRPTSVNVTVRFRQGTITEWFPRAVVTPTRTVTGAYPSGFTSTITWNNVNISPGAAEDYPRENGPSHYYAARATDAAPLTLGSQKEKFLFYRGVGRFSIPLAATVGANGKIVVTNTGTDPVASVILFQNHGGRIGYRVHRLLDRDVTFDPPALEGQFGSLAAQLKRILVSEGLYPKEAESMIETWRDSWFEEGTRLFYIVPPKVVDAVLPLTITPQPTQTARVFVGRLELITPAIMKDVEDAIASRDVKGLARYGRFVPSILDRIYPAARTTPAQRAAADRLLQALYQTYAKTAVTCPAASVNAAGSPR